MSNKIRNRYDPGAIHVEDGREFEEAGIALQYGARLREILTARGVAAFMTRDSRDDHAPYRERARNAEASGCQMLISLHLNDFEDDQANGLEVLYNGEENLPLAQVLQSVLCETTGFRDRGVKRRPDLAVLKFDGPSVMIELGFIANDGNREVLINPSRREEICERIADTVIR